MPRVYTNKHGFPGIVKHSKGQRRKPYYFQLNRTSGRYRTRGFATAEEAHQASAELKQRVEGSPPAEPREQPKPFLGGYKSHLRRFGK